MFRRSAVNKCYYTKTQIKCKLFLKKILKFFGRILILEKYEKYCCII
jgi:hypothetical protein